MQKTDTVYADREVYTSAGSCMAREAMLIKCTWIKPRQLACVNTKCVAMVISKVSSKGNKQGRLEAGTGTWPRVFILITCIFHMNEGLYFSTPIMGKCCQIIHIISLYELCKHAEGPLIEEPQLENAIWGLNYSLQ